MEKATGHRNKRTERQADLRAAAKRQILETLAKGLSPVAAAKAAGVAYSTIWTWKREDAAFSAAWDEAFEQGTDVLEDIALKRATVGNQRPVYQGGKQVGTVQEFSDHLLLATLARRREAWRQSKTKVELSGKDGGPVQVHHVRALIAEKLAALAGGPVNDNAGQAGRRLRRRQGTKHVIEGGPVEEGGRGSGSVKLRHRMKGAPHRRRTEAVRRGD